MAHTKAGRTTKGNRNSIAKRLGLKVYGGEWVKPGNIIVRQRGSKFRAGQGTYLGKDFTIHASQEGIVDFVKRQGNLYVTVSPAAR